MVLLMSRTELEVLLQPVANSGDLKQFLWAFVDLSVIVWRMFIGCLLRNWKTIAIVMSSGTSLKELRSKLMQYAKPLAWL